MRKKAETSLKWLYGLALIGSLLVNFTAAGSWVGLAMGSSGLVFLLPQILVFGYRISLVIRFPATLDAFVLTRLHSWLRKLGILLMLVGTPTAFLMPLSPYLVQWTIGNDGSRGIAIFAISVVLAAGSSLGLLGVLCFESSRLLGFEGMLRPREKHE